MWMTCCTHMSIHLGRKTFLLSRQQASSYYYFPLFQNAMTQKQFDRFSWFFACELVSMWGFYKSSVLKKSTSGSEILTSGQISLSASVLIDCLSLGNEIFRDDRPMSVDDGVYHEFCVQHFLSKIWVYFRFENFQFLTFFLFLNIFSWNI